MKVFLASRGYTGGVGRLATECNAPSNFLTEIIKFPEHDKQNQFNPAR